MGRCCLHEQCASQQLLSRHLTRNKPKLNHYQVAGNIDIHVILTILTALRFFCRYQEEIDFSKDLDIVLTLNLFWLAFNKRVLKR